MANKVTFKKPSDLSTPSEAGVPSFTESEARRIGEGNLPAGSIIVSETTSSTDVISGRGTRTAGSSSPKTYGLSAAEYEAQARAREEARIRAEVAAKEEAARKAAEEEAKRRAQQELLEQQKLSRAERERLAALSKIAQQSRDYKQNRLLNTSQRNEAEAEYERQKEEYIQFQTDLATGKIQGFSGTGLSPQEYSRRKVLMDIGAIKETKKPQPYNLRQVEELSSEYFIEKDSQTKPTFEQTLRAQQFREADFKALSWLDRANSRLKAAITEPIGKGISYVSQKVGGPKSLGQFKKETGAVIDYVGDLTVPEYISQAAKIPKPYRQYAKLPTSATQQAQLTAGVGFGVIEDIYEEPATNLALFGIGAGVGAAVKGAPIAAKAIKSSKYAEDLGFVTTASKSARDYGLIGKGAKRATKVGAKFYDPGLKVAKEVPKILFRVGKGGVKAGVGGAIALDVGARAYAEPTTIGKGEVIGESLLELAEFGAGAKAGAKAARYIGEPITIKTPTRPLNKEASFIEVQKEVSTGDILKPKASYRLYQEIAPPIKVETTTGLRRDLGLKPLDAFEKPARFGKVSTLGDVSPGKPFSVAEFVQGRKQVKISKVGGKQDEFKLKNYKDLTPPERRALQNLAEDIASEKGLKVLDAKGKPVKEFDERTLKELFGDDTTITHGGIISRQTLKLKPRKTFVDISKTSGKKTLRAGASISKVDPLYETDDVAVSRASTELKELPIDRPLKRVSKKTSKLRGVLVELKEPQVGKQKPFDFLEFEEGGFEPPKNIKKFAAAVYKETSGVQRIIPAKMKKTPLSKTFQEPTQKKEQKLKALLPKKLIRTYAPRGVSTSKQSPITAYRSTNLFREPSVYQGQGQYELTTGGTSPRTFQRPTLTPLFKGELLPRYKVKLETKERLSPKLINKLSPKLQPKVKLEPKERLAPKLQSKQASKLALKQLLKLKEKSKLPELPPPSIRLRPPREEKLPFYLPKLKGEIPKRKKQKEEFKDNLFYTPGFTERVLNIRRKATRQQLRSKALRGDIEFRPIPIFTPTRKKKKLRVGVD